MSRQNKLAKAMELVTEELRADKTPGSYYYSWQSNIAMCIYDTWRRGGSRMEDKVLLGLSNAAAQQFLEMLLIPPDAAVPTLEHRPAINGVVPPLTELKGMPDKPNPETDTTNPWT